MTLTQLEYAIVLDETRHFHKAAKKCFVTQPTLSQQISKLEQSLSILIFDRSKTPIKPTMEGKEFLKKARKIVGLSKELHHHDFSESGLTGDFKLGVIPTLAPYVIPLFAKSFSSSYPNVSLFIEEMKTEDIITALENDLIDGALLVTPLGVESINEKILYYEELHFFCDENNHLLKSNKTLDPSSLKSSDLWTLEKGHCFRDQTLNLCSIQEQEEEKLHSSLSYQSGNILTLIKMVESFGGITLLPEMALDQLTKKQKSRILKIKGPTPTREISLVHSRLFEKEAIINALTECINKNIPTNFKRRKTPKHIIPIH